MSIIKSLAQVSGNIKESFEIIKANKAELIKEKKAMLKNHISVVSSDTAKAYMDFDIKSLIDLKDDEVFVVGNSVGFYDSHGDVSLRGSWTKTTKEVGRYWPPVKDHRYLVDNIYAKNISAHVLEIPIKALGYDAIGTTEIVGLKIKPYSELDMQKYIDGTINQHSMALEYMKISLAMNDEREEGEYKAWQAYYNSIINKDAVDKAGYFWAIHEQKGHELSSVVFASNTFTPAFLNKKSLLVEPSADTQKQKPIASSFFSNYLNSK
jgi:hypothetical protein